MRDRESGPQSIYGNRYQFLNPLRQNYKHLKAVENLLGLGPRCLHSVVVFVGNSEFKTMMPPNVLERRQLVPYIRSKTDILLSDKQVEDSIQNPEEITYFEVRNWTKACSQPQREPA